MNGKNKHRTQQQEPSDFTGQPSAARGCAECLNLTMGTAQQDALVWCWPGPFHSHMITVESLSRNGYLTAAVALQIQLTEGPHAETVPSHKKEKHLITAPSALSRRETLPAPAAVREANRLIDNGKTIGDTRDPGGQMNQSASIYTQHHWPRHDTVEA
ncbi:unnamed protein product [Boreogadus saida]